MQFALPCTVFELPGLGVEPLIYCPNPLNIVLNYTPVGQFLPL